jgi:hypothetical protein
LCGLLILAGGWAGELRAQTAWRVPLYVRDNGGRADTLKFGVHPTGTYCKDTHVLRFGNCDSIVESELPPIPPGGVFDARFVDHRTGANACMGVGQTDHIQAFTSGTDIDTFRLQVQPGAGGYPFRFRWPTGLAPFADSIIFRNALGIPPPVGAYVNMATIDSVTVTNSLFTQFYVIVYRPKTPPLPETPTLSTPDDNQANVDTNVTFTWSAATGATYYRLEVSTDSLFGSFALRESLTTTTRSVRLPANNTYFWRVSAGNVYINGCPQASPFRFSTITTGPAAPTLIAPAQGATGADAHLERLSDRDVVQGGGVAQRGVHGSRIRRFGGHRNLPYGRSAAQLRHEVLEGASHQYDRDERLVGRADVHRRGGGAGGARPGGPGRRRDRPRHQPDALLDGGR